MGMIRWVRISQELPYKAGNISLQFFVGSAVHKECHPARTHSVGLGEITTQDLKRLLGILFVK